MNPLRPIALAFLLALPAFSGEAGILGSKLVGQAQTATTGTQAHYDQVSPTAIGFRVGWTLLDLKVMELSLNGTYLPKSEVDLKVSGAKLGTYGVEYVAVGAQLDFKVLLNLNVGAEVRQERLTWDLLAGGKAESTQSRPWLRAGLGFSIPTPILSPFARLEVAIPISKEDRTGTDAEIRKALAPRAQFGVYAGIRF